MKKTTCLARTFVLLGLVLVALVAVSSDVQAQGGNKNPGVIPPNAKYRGLTYGEWARVVASGVLDSDRER